MTSLRERRDRDDPRLSRCSLVMSEEGRDPRDPAETLAKIG
jgi:hypothetical protein